MTAYRLIGPAKISACSTCGGINRTHGSECRQCKQKAEIASMAKRNCANCGLEIPTTRRRGTPYCSAQCAIEVVGIAQKAGAVVRSAIRTGRLPRLDGSVMCVDCGNPARHYEHRDYTKPIDVVPVCQSCNRKRGPADVIKVAA